jgi:hypothetical protein
MDDWNLAVERKVESTADFLETGWPEKFSVTSIPLDDHHKSGLRGAAISEFHELEQ